MSRFEFSKNDFSGFKKAFEHCKNWSSEHHAEIGLAEMALGASIVTAAVYTGQIDIGPELVATKLSDSGVFGGAAGASLGGIGASLLGSIGVAGTFTFGIPVDILACGGMLILGAAGYGAGDIAHKLLAPDIGISDLVAGGSMLNIGVALILDGARRVVTDERLLAKASKFKDGIIELVPLMTEVVVNRMDQLQEYIKELGKGEKAVWVAVLTGGPVFGLGMMAWKGVQRLRNAKDSMPPV